MTDDKKHRILVVDDDPVINKLMSNLLESNGYEPIVVDEAPVGLEIAMKECPDLIILDVMMPIINGFNVCRLLKSEKGCCHIPIILLTSRSEEKDRQIGMEVGANGYISKPFNTDELLQKVRELLDVSAN